MPSDSDSSLPLAVWQSIERICTEYERALRNGGPIDTADLLPQVPPEAQSVLLRELNAVAADYRRASQTPSAAEQSTQTYLGDAAAGIDTATGLHPETSSALRPGTTPASLTWPKRLWWAAMIATCLFFLLLWGWQALVGEQVRTISTSDPRVEVVIQGGHVISARDPIENRDYPLVGQRLIFAHAFTDRGLKLPLVDGTSMRLRKDSDGWTIIRPASVASAHQSQPNPPSSEPPRGPMPFQQAVDFREAHDLDIRGLRSWVKSLPKEFTPVDINARVHADPPLFNAIAVRNSAPVSSAPAKKPTSFWNALTGTATTERYRIEWEISNEKIQKSWDENDGNVWALTVVSPFVRDGKRFVHHLWEKDREAWGWWAWWGRHWNDVPAAIETNRKERMRPIQISMNPPPAKTGVTGIAFRPDEGLNWHVDFDLTADQLEWKIKLAREKHWRPDTLAAYDDGTGKATLYSLVTVSNPSAARWEFRRDLSTENLEAAISDFRTRALRPKVLTSESMTNGHPRYTGIWVEFSPPERLITTDAAPVSALDAFATPRAEPVGEVRRFEGWPERNWITRCAFTPDGKRVLASAGPIREWDIETGKELAYYATTAPYNWGLDVSPDGNFVATAGDDAKLYVWLRQANRNVSHWATGMTGPYGFGCRFSPDGKQLVSWTGHGESLFLWDWKKQSLIRKLETPQGNGSACFTPDGSRILGAGTDQVLRIWHGETGELVHRHRNGHTSGLNAVACSPDGRYAVTASHDQTLAVWDLEQGVRVRQLKGHTASVRAVSIAPDGRRVFSGADDRTARVWDLQSGQELAVFEANTVPGATPAVSDVQISPDGQYGLTCAFDGTVRLWRLPELPATRMETPQ